MPVQRVVVLFFTMVSILVPCRGEENERSNALPPPSHADAAIIFAKYSGLFDMHVPENSDLTFCVSFLNKHGIYFGLMEVVNGKEFDKVDCARVMGQIELVLSGEADYLAGKVVLPKGIASWEDFCIMNGIFFKEAHEAMIRAPRRTK